ncbi:MAG: hypothetical protein AAB784_00090 [Patescibacteria group bacterium]
MPTNADRANKIRLGFSTGCLYKSEPSIIRRLEVIRNIGCRTVELGFVKLDGFWGEIDQVISQPKCLDDFDYVSLHAPVAPYGFDRDSMNIFRKIAQLHLIRKLNLVVFHPDEVKGFEFFPSWANSIDLPFAFENMDNRKGSYKNLLDMQGLSCCVYRFRMVLDVNHAFSNDPTMGLARDFHRCFKGSIVQTHLSGYKNGHVPLFETKQIEIIEGVRNIKKPIIIESVLESYQLSQERNYILEVLEK